MIHHRGAEDEEETHDWPQMSADPSSAQRKKERSPPEHIGGLRESV
jgi:hypothetical protein